MVMPYSCQYKKRPKRSDGFAGEGFTPIQNNFKECTFICAFWQKNDKFPGETFPNYSIFVHPKSKKKDARRGNL